MAPVQIKVNVEMTITLLAWESEYEEDTAKERLLDAICDAWKTGKFPRSERIEETTGCGDRITLEIIDQSRSYYERTYKPHCD